MPTNATRTASQSFNNQEAFVFSWTLAAGETGEAIVLPGHADRSVQFFGSFSGGASVVLEGTNELNEAAAANFMTYLDPFGNLIQKSTPDKAGVTEAMRATRSRVIGGDGSTAITILLYAKR